MGELMRMPGSAVAAKPLSSPPDGGVTFPFGADPAPKERGCHPAREAVAAATEEVVSLRSEVADLRALILAQNSLLEQLVRAQAQIRVSRSQERALRAAIRERAAGIAETERLPSRPISSAILKTVREISGVRALGDVPAEKYDKILDLIRGWHMAGALRRIRKQLAAS